MSVISFSSEERKVMLSLARESIQYYLKHGQRFVLDLTQYPDQLRQPYATFVTLKQSEQLRGCIGHLEAIYPLVEDVANNAVSAAVQDYRFARVSLDELQYLSISISILSEPVKIMVANENDLLSQIEVGKDGLILKYRSHQATFLPAVWESLSDKNDFVNQLKVKAGLAADFWDDAMEFQTYRSFSFSE